MLLIPSVCAIGMLLVICTFSNLFKLIRRGSDVRLGLDMKVRKNMITFLCLCLVVDIRMDVSMDAEGVAQF